VHDRSTPQRELGFELVVAAPIPKGDRAQFLIEKLTELGVTRFFPLRTTRSIINPRESKLERFERYVIEASKQCGRNVLMAIEPLAEWSEFCQRSDLPAERRLAHVGATRAPVTTTGDVVCAVGPEGGFTDIEVQSALDHGWQLVELGPRILRIETAALVIAALARFTPLRP
jgi:16S rRNA (uracil1498-N3)-methyltransferase